jgi:hypothetical protein
MVEKSKTQHPRPEEIIAAFDRERERIKELNRRHAEQVRATRDHDRPVFIERRRHPR